MVFGPCEPNTILTAAGRRHPILAAHPHEAAIVQRRQRHLNADGCRLRATLVPVQERRFRWRGGTHLEAEVVVSLYGDDPLLGVAGVDVADRIEAHGLREYALPEDGHWSEQAHICS